MEKQKTVDAFILKHPEWQEELKVLREIALASGLDESIKWNFPVYSLAGKNLIGLGAFKSYAGVWFFQGALLKDKGKHLLNAQEGKTKAMRQWRFNSRQELDKALETLSNYINEAIDNQKAGKKIQVERIQKPLDIPLELSKAIGIGGLETAFAAMSPGKQREFAEYISTAKRPETKSARVEKVLPMILNGIGLNDKYRK